MNIKNRIVEQRTIPARELKPHPHNWRKHPKKQRAAFRAVLDEIGFAGVSLVYRSERHSGALTLIDGHMRLEEVGDFDIPCAITDLTDQEADKLLVLAAPLGDMAEADPAQLDALLRLVTIESEELEELMHGVAQDLGCEYAAPADIVQDEAPLPPDEPITKRGDLWILGNHRLLCGDSSCAEDVDRLLDGATIDLVNTDPPYNVKVEPRSNNAIAAGNSSFANPNKHHQKFDLERHPEKAKKTHKKMRAKDRPLANDFVSDSEFDDLLHAWFGNLSRVLDPGRSFYIWGGYANLGNYPPVLKANGLYFSQGIVWDKQHPVLTRKDFMGSFELCQPPDTSVMTSCGSSPISSLRDGDRVVAFSSAWAGIIGNRLGPEIRVGQRHYGGPLYGVTVSKKTTWATDGHHFSVRLTANAREVWCVYLMRKGDWWRVGKTKLLTTWGLGLKQRLEMENGEEAWILSTHLSNQEATTGEQIVSARYGIPTTFWVEANTSKRTPAQIALIYESIDPLALHRGALWALSDHHRRLQFPFIRSGRTRDKFGCRVSFRCHACNLLPSVMEVPMPCGGQKHQWRPIANVDVQHYSGPVFSLEVEKYHHYIADGIVTHNCFYGWKEGAGHQFFGPNNARDLWQIKKVNPQSMVHLTEKPVELAARAIEYSSKPGENVLDLFGGSGSTLMACEQTGRKAFLMELDPPYCDVICERWQKFSGQKAQRISAAEVAV